MRFEEKEGENAVLPRFFDQSGIKRVPKKSQKSDNSRLKTVCMTKENKDRVCRVCFILQRNTDNDHLFVSHLIVENPQRPDLPALGLNPTLEHGRTSAHRGDPEANDLLLLSLYLVHQEELKGAKNIVRRCLGVLGIGTRADFEASRMKVQDYSTLNDRIIIHRTIPTLFDAKRKGSYLFRKEIINKLGDYIYFFQVNTEVNKGEIKVYDDSFSHMIEDLKNRKDCRPLPLEEGFAVGERVFTEASNRQSAKPSAERLNPIYHRDDRVLSLRGTWLSSWYDSDGQNRWLSEYLEISTIHGRVKIVSRKNDAGYEWEAEGQLESFHYLHGKWYSTHPGALSIGAFILVYFPQGDALAGQAIGPAKNGRPINFPWAIGRTIESLSFARGWLYGEFIRPEHSLLEFNLADNDFMQ